MSARRACWPLQALRHRTGDERIRQNLKSAYRPVPKSARGPRAKPQATWKAIRRVALPGRTKLVALTFDLCEQPHEISGYQGTIVDFLRRENVAATFFAGGKWMLTHPERAQQLMADPLFEIGNHAWEHRNFRLLNARQIHDEIAHAQVAYTQVRERLVARGCLARNGQSVRRIAPPTMTLFRFPFGACKAQALRGVQRAGLHTIQWDVSSADPWRGMTTAKMVPHVLKRTRSGSILLFHANGRGWHTPQSLPLIVTALKKRGYRFATVTDLLAQRGARPVLADTCFDARPGDSERYDDVSARLHAKYERFYARFGFRPSAGNGDSVPAREQPWERSR
ncbi:MAG: polysaccharide deacetylase family protein [Pseudomonadota bacterium]